MHRKPARVLSLFVGAALLFCAAAPAQIVNTPAVKKLKLRIISNPSGVKEPEVINDLVVVDKKTAIAFGGAIAIDNSLRLVSYRISNRGKASGANVIDVITADVAAIWNPSSHSVPPSAPYGLVYYTYKPGNKIIVRVAKFDAGGKLTADTRDLLELPISTGNFISWTNLAASVGSRSIGITLSFKTYQGGWDEPGDAVAYFLQTDFDGKLIGSATKVPFSNGGIDELVSLRNPLQAGANWLVPLISSNIKTGQSSAAVVQIKRSKAKVLTVFDASLSGGLDAEGGNAQFLPPATSSGQRRVQISPAGVSFDLLIHHYSGLPNDPLRIRSEDYFLTVQKVKRTGKKAGNPYNLEADQWIPKLTPDVNRHLDLHREYLSYAAVNNDGKLLVAKSRFLQRSWNAAPPVTMRDYENQLLLYSIDIKKRKADVIAVAAPDADQTIGAPILVSKEGKIWVISHYKKSSEMSYHSYLSYF